MKYYKFVKHDDDIPNFEELHNNLIDALKAADNGNREPLKSLHIATETPILRLSGWAVPYSEYLRRYWVKTKYYGIREYYALNKTDIRKELKSWALEIVEV